MNSSRVRFNSVASATTAARVDDNAEEGDTVPLDSPYPYGEFVKIQQQATHFKRDTLFFFSTKKKTKKKIIQVNPQADSDEHWNESQ